MPRLRLPQPTPISLTVAWLVLLVLLALLLATSQRDFGWGRYEYGVLQPFQGRLRLAPYPALEVERPLLSPDWSAVSVYPLSGGGGAEFARNLTHIDGTLVTLNARILCVGDLTMLEVAPESIRPFTRTVDFPEPEPVRPVAHVTLRGEIVDLKSYLGYREPELGDLLRSPASSAIRAGIPPVLVVADAEGRRRAFLLVDTSGAPIGEAALGRIATPLEITGQLRMWADFPILAAEPSSYRRLWFWE